MSSSDKDASLAGKANGQKAPSSTENGSKGADEQSKTGQSNIGQSKVDNASESSKSSKPDKKEGRKLQRLLHKLKGEIKDTSSKQLLEKAEKLAKGIFKRKSVGSADGKDGKGDRDF